ncbi:hypothetical protein BGZ61DRAFT_466827 [Ilyonectria robusta]|uniref:uncharacterized protein n=1 Tax=Ilyonectria robusta TaxID=1079257 RepID=UPI001E8EF001|nr:uncharacterized protein BGZ61DRAFT_466827 [Ilyonectria robusta]KAH8656323.1 hypothetical protein BGZ61DRAFT_466827 [Ilyonectria robusta]
MSSECERCFSLAKLQVSSQRHRQHHTTIRCCQCLKNWARLGAFDWGTLGLCQLDDLLQMGQE